MDGSSKRVFGRRQHLFGFDGEPITLEEYGALHEDPAKFIVAQETVEGYFVSTVWLGVSFYDPPLIYETMLFDQILGEKLSDYDFDCAQWRYATRAEAQAGHVVICAAVRESALKR